jgi:Acetyltransferase (GNAT) domain
MHECAKMNRAKSQRMSLRLFLWIAMKNAVHPFRRLITWQLECRHRRFDRRAGVHTAGRVTLQELGLSPEKSVRYEATPISFFHSLLAKLPIDYPRTVFVDFGSGKGRTLLLASHYPFRSIIGIEISPALCQIALDNINKYRSRRQQCSDISIVCKGIDEFEYAGLATSGHILVYIFNPCSASVLAPAMQRLSRLVSQGVSVTVVYLNPVWLEVLTEAAWLKQIRAGETFDEAGNSFMPYVVFQGLPPPWEDRIEMLAFQFGPLVFGKWQFASVSNAASPLVTQTRSIDRPPVLQPITYQQMPDDGTISRTLSFDRKAIRYAAYRGQRYFIDLASGSLNDYLARFSSKTRNTLRRKVRHFAEHSGGTIDFRYYASPDEMIEFRHHAIALSLLTYQRKIGWAFPETEEFKNRLIEDAEAGRVCGFLLMHDNTPVAYAFCRTQQDIMTYAVLGYDPGFARLSPGTVLLTLIIERLFMERRFRLFDFGGMAAEYKAFFATGSVDYVKVIWFPATAQHFLLVTAHYLVRQAWQGASWLKRAGMSGSHNLRAFLTPRLPPRSPAPTRTSGAAEDVGVSIPSRKAAKRAPSQPVRQ